MDIATNDGHAQAGETLRPSFTGTAGAMFPVVLKGLALTILTLGIYRFWYMTNVRRFLWNNTEVGGDLVEYTGRGVELFIGFLIALAVLIPLYGLLFLVGLQAGPEVAGALQVASTLVVVILAQFAIYQARRYRLTRTVWRGIRFQQTGSGFAYAFRSFAWGLFVILTIGLAYPWMRANLERYKMTNTWYGDQRGAFSATGWGLFKRGVLLWLVALILVAGGAALIAAIGVGLAAEGGAPRAEDLAAGALPLLLLLGLAVIVPVYWAVEYRWWAEGCSVGPATAACDLGLFAFFRVYLGYLGIVLLFGVVLSIVGGAIAYAAMSSGALESFGGQPPVGVFVIGALAYFVIALAFAALWQVFGVRPIWRRSFESVTISGLGMLTAAQSAEPAANAFGEGVADAIDFGGF